MIHDVDDLALDGFRAATNRDVSVLGSMSPDGAYERVVVPCQFGLLHLPNRREFSASESSGLWTRWAALNRTRRVTVTGDMFRVRYQTKSSAGVLAEL